MANNYSFEAFTNWRSKYATKISISTNGSIGFSSGFCTRYQVKPGQYVKLFYDAKRMAVAFKFDKHKSEGAAKLAVRGKEGAYISATSFLKRYDIDATKSAQAYAPLEITDPHIGRIYVIHITQAA